MQSRRERGHRPPRGRQEREAGLGVQLRGQVSLSHPGHCQVKVIIKGHRRITRRRRSSEDLLHHQSLFSRRLAIIDTDVIQDSERPGPQEPGRGRVPVERAGEGEQVEDV